MLGLQPVQGGQLRRARAAQLLVPPFGDPGVVLGVAAPGIVQVPACSSFSSANSRIISSMATRGSPSGPSVTVIRLTSSSPAARSRGSAPVLACETSR